MTEKNFLLNLYKGRFNSELFSLTPAGETSPRALKVIEAYKDAVREYTPIELEKQKRIPEELFEKLKKTGLFGLTIPEEYGGSGFSLTEYLQVVEQMAGKDMALAIVPLAHLSIGLKGILLYGSAGLKKHYLTLAASGQMIFAYALTEPLTGSDAQHIATKAVLSEDKKYYILNGTKTFITNGGYAGGLTVFAQLDPEKPGFMGAFVVETGWEGIKTGRDMDKMGLTVSSTTSITLTNVKVPVKNMIGEPGEGFKIAMQVLNYGRLGLGAASAGIMNQSLKEMKKRAARRIQFNVPINTFRLIQEKQVKAKVYSYMTSAMTYYTARLLEENPHQNAAIESSHCKLFGTTTAWNTLYDTLQTAGGAGYLKSGPYEKRMRDFRVTTVFEGTTEIHSIYPPLVIARSFLELLKKAGTGEKTAFFARAFFGSRINTGCKIGDPVLGKALAECEKLANLIRKKVLQAMKKYKKKITEREYLLRRITDSSVYLYGLLSILAGFLPAGKKPSEEEKVIITYIITEAKLLRKEWKEKEQLTLDKLKDRLFKLIQ